MEKYFNPGDNGINGRKESKDKLVRKLKFLFDSNPQPMWIFDLESLAFLDVNDCAVLQYGFTKNEFLKMTLKEICPPEDVEFFINEFTRNKWKVERRNEWRHKRKNGEIIYVEITSLLIEYENRPARLVVATEITRRKLALQNLEIQKRFFEQTFIQSSTSTQILDKDGWCLRINPKLSELFGVKPEHIEGHLYNIFDDAEIIRNGIDIILRRVFTDRTVEQWEVLWDNAASAESQNIRINPKKKTWFFLQGLSNH